MRGVVTGVSVALGLSAAAVLALDDAPTMVAGLSLDSALEAPGASAASRRAEPVLVGLHPAPRPQAPSQPEPVLDPYTWIPNIPASTWAKLKRARGWLASNRALAGLPDAKDPAAQRAGLERLLQRPDVDGVVRQNLIFHIALSLPPSLAEPWLDAAAHRATGELWSEEDREDVLVARAFAGYSDAVIDFQALARTPSPARVHRLVDRVEALDRLGQGGTTEARQVLRSYHAIEVLDREPYFKMLGYYVRLPWREQGWREVPTEVRERLHSAWLTRYPGHPGSDDVAFRMGLDHMAASRNEAAARWFARATGLPDGDARNEAESGLIALAELYLSPSQLGSMAFVEGTNTPSHQILLYIRARRLAAEEGYQAGLAAIEDAVRHGDAPALDHAWRSRWHAHVPRGLTSGRLPLLRPGRLLTQEQEPDLPTIELDEIDQALNAAREADDWDAWEALWSERRLNPRRDQVGLHPGRLARQLRLWESLAELERRAREARGEARADLLYKQAAVLYHQRSALMPVYNHVGWRFRSVLWGPYKTSPEIFGDAVRRFRRTSMGSRRALAVLERIEREHPRWAGMDQVLFTKGLAWRRAADRTLKYIWTGERASNDLTAQALRQLVACMQAVRTRFPESPLADDAERAVSYWRSQKRYAIAR